MYGSSLLFISTSPILNFLADLLVFAVMLSILVLVHELGHFLTAKKFGIKVEEFGFGLPPRIFGIKRGETIYSINWLPIGGFVRMFGEDEDPTKNKK
jgi:regulator of sigma E protease